MKMSDKDPDVWASVLAGLKSAWPTIYAALLAGLIAYARLIYDCGERKNKWAEGVICGALALTISGLLDYFGLPVSLTPFLGGMVGFIGTDQLRGIAVGMLKRKTGSS
ncbi:phage holin, lambda family [Pectobacterium carotovorum]|uniref:phage holin, lambda family n=1 Tax=Pectobacterium carotovorum TaxID=554 RepID=UPI001F0D5E02|nr:phage holin, lambda family [Pectobacterium carotovorum]